MNDLQKFSTAVNFNYDYYDLQQNLHAWTVDKYRFNLRGKKLGKPYTKKGEHIFFFVIKIFVCFIKRILS